MIEAYRQEFHVRWADLDPNMHLRHTAYADMCAATRFSFLEQLGFTMAKFQELQIGPIIFEEHIKYMAEIRPGDKIVVNLRIAGLSEKGHKWKMHHEIFRKSDQTMAASLSISGAWFDLVKRKVTLPPDILKDKVDQMARTADFKSL